MIGTAWFDINQNNKRDASEPLLAGVDVELVPVVASASKMSSSGVRAMATQTLRTNALGGFDFSTVAPGTYAITGVLPGSFGINQSWDSTGDDDWRITVTVVARGTARGDFAAIGDVDILAGVSEAECIALGGEGEISLNWAGIDQSVGNADDASFATSLGSDCSFSVAGIPTGKYSITAVNTDTGKKVTLPRFSIPRGASRVEMSVSKASVDVKVISVATAVALPKTGASAQSVLSYALALIAAGLVVSSQSVLTRRRRRR